MTMRAWMVLPAALALAACTGAQTQSPEPSLQAATASGPVARIGSLERQPLVAARCGLFICKAPDDERDEG